MLNPNRKGRITASAVGAILGLSPFTTRAQQLDRMIKEWQGLSSFDGNVATEYGHMHEVHARRKLESILMETIPEDRFYCNDWLGATPDGFTSENDNVELKCPYGLRNGGAFKSIKHQQHYYAQIQIQMYLTQRKFTHFFQWSAHGYMHEIIAYDQKYIDEILPKLKAFYDEYLELRDKPMQRDDLLNTVMQIKEYDAQIEILTDLKKELIQKLEQEADGHNIVIGDFEFKKIDRKGSIDYARYLKDHNITDIEDYRKDGSTYWKLS